MINTFAPVLVLIFFSAGFLLTMLLASILLGPRRYSEVKDDPFECGTIGTGNPRSRIGVKYYLVAVIFILFDIEIAYMFPWAVKAVALGWYGYFIMMSFISILVVSLIYVWKRGVLDWAK